MQTYSVTPQLLASSRLQLAARIIPGKSPQFKRESLSRGRGEGVSLLKRAPGRVGPETKMWKRFRPEDNVMGSPLVIVFGLVLPVMIALAVIIRLAAGSMDRGRIEAHIEAQGGEVIKVTWSPFGPGWFGNRNERIYAVRYVDRQGYEHQAYCKTSMFAGVYFAQDHYVIGSDRRSR
jgi:hypothetical protein